MVFGGMSKNNGGCLKINLRWPLFQSFRFKFSVIKEFILSDSFSRIKKLSKRLLLQDWVLWPSDQTQFPFSSVHENLLKCLLFLWFPNTASTSWGRWLWFFRLSTESNFLRSFSLIFKRWFTCTILSERLLGNGILTDIPCNSEPGILIWSVHHFFYRYKRGHPIFILR